MASMRVTRVAVATEPLVASSYDYADAFVVQLEGTDDHAAEVWVRTGLEGSGAVVRSLIRFVHGRILRFELRDGTETVLGWRIVHSVDDVVHLRTGGPLLRAEIVARRTSPSAAGFSTFLSYESRAARPLWRVIGPLHRRIAPFLLRRAATRLTR